MYLCILPTPYDHMTQTYTCFFPRKIHESPGPKPGTSPVMPSPRVDLSRWIPSDLLGDKKTGLRLWNINRCDLWHDLLESWILDHLGSISYRCPKTSHFFRSVPARSPTSPGHSSSVSGLVSEGDTSGDTRLSGEISNAQFVWGWNSWAWCPEPIDFQSESSIFEPCRARCENRAGNQFSIVFSVFPKNIQKINEYFPKLGHSHHQTGLFQYGDTALILAKLVFSHQIFTDMIQIGNWQN